MNLKTAIIYFCYNRKDHTALSLPKILEYCLDLPVFIFCDGPLNKQDEIMVNKVKYFVKDITSGIKQCNLYFRSKNYGLAKNIIHGVNQVFNQGFDSVIVLEDDCIPKTDYFSFMLNALDTYSNNEKIMHISGFGLPIKTINNSKAYITPYPCSWGWATWRNHWIKCNFNDEIEYEKLLSNGKLKKLFNWSGDAFSHFLKLQLDGRINSWLIRWYFHIFKHKGVCIWATKSKICNIGFDGSGQHNVKFDLYNQKDIDNLSHGEFESDMKFNLSIISEFRMFFNGPRIWDKLKTLIYLKTGLIFDKVKPILYYND